MHTLPNPSSQGLINKQPAYFTPLCRGLLKGPSQPFWRQETISHWKTLYLITFWQQWHSRFTA